MTASETNNIEVVRKYFAGCNSGDLDVLRSTLAQNVVHYFRPARFPPIKGADHLARYWRGSEWHIMRDARIAEVRAYLIG